jgi:hypothetical protein
LVSVGAALFADGRLKDGDDDWFCEGREKLGLGGVGGGSLVAIRTG